jgi:hypothetical protein
MRRAVFRAKAVEPVLVIRDLAGFELQVQDSQWEGVQDDWQGSILIYLLAPSLANPRNPVRERINVGL